MKIAVIRVRGMVNLKQGDKYTLSCLNLKNSNHCVVVEDTPVNRGMIEKVSHIITWGRIDKPTFELMLSKRGRLEGDKRINMDETEIKSFTDDFFNNKKSLKDINVKPYFRLKPPKKGYGRAGIKKPFELGGALGPRLEKINELIRRMV
ncbi:MAG: 50S ribosomal protein L30 [Candidatus Nanoarchaeia archaeon]|nr:50S ribosomal protein L30 [Candidatus Nanoarchaeia archaeon]